MHFDFTITLTGLATVLSILGGAWGIMRGLRRIQETISVAHWEHKVMWWYFTRTDKPIPEYPHMPKEEDSRG